jgi:hypothetical protein
MKHNKKRNTAFLYESLIKELTKAIVRQDNSKKTIVVEIIKKYFHKDSVLREHLDIYSSLLDTSSDNRDYVFRLMYETKKDYDRLDKKSIFNSQTDLIKEINESLSNEVFANFISSYRDLATIGQFLDSDSLGAKQRILIESKIASVMSVKKKSKKEMKHIDNLTYSTFVNKFNVTYENSLRQEQKDLLTNYITSFSDNGLGLKSFLNEEIGRLKSVLGNITGDASKEDKLLENTKKVVAKLQSFSKKPITEEVVRDIFYIQDLAYEVTK